MIIKIGLDEAGRGCVLGSLYVGAVVFESSSDEKYFKSLGVKDSKQLTPEKRESLFSEISKHCFYGKRIIETDAIDSGNLNDLEFDAMLSVVTSIIRRYEDASITEPDFHIYIDCPIRDTNEHAEMISNALPHPCSVKVTSEHKADDKYIVVGASSIVAKVLRDRQIDEIKQKYVEEYGDIGSGYPSDWKTKQFLQEFFKKNGSFPIETRMKWGTVEKIRRELCEDPELERQELRDHFDDGETDSSDHREE